MFHNKDFPRYDDLQHIDSNAVNTKMPCSRERAPMQDPDATAYTEMYCAPTHAIDPQPTPHKQ